MTKNAMTYDQAGKYAIEILTKLSRYRMYFTISNNPDKKQFYLVAIKDADLVKHLIPTANIEEDLHRRRFAELYIKYE